MVLCWQTQSNLGKLVEIHAELSDGQPWKLMPSLGCPGRSGKGQQKTYCMAVGTTSNSFLNVKLCPSHHSLKCICTWYVHNRVLLHNGVKLDFSGDTSGKEPTANAGAIREGSSIPGWGRSPGEENGNPLQYSFLKNSMDRGAWWAPDHRAAESPSQLRD